jgi:hypothetical protein
MSAFIDRRRYSSGNGANEIFEVQPIILGGDPTDPANKTCLTREQHIEAVRYWNGVIRNLRNKT